jgi:hypothetical protein
MPEDVARPHDSGMPPASVIKFSGILTGGRVIELTLPRIFAFDKGKSGDLGK